MRNFKEWFSAAELVGIQGLPSSPQGINKKARTQGWKKRNREGVQGGAVEYHYSSFPVPVQETLGFKPKIGRPLPFILGGAALTVGASIGKPKNFEDKPNHLNDIDLQERIIQLENKLKALEDKTQIFVSTNPSDGLNKDEWQLVCAFRRCNDDRRVGLLATAEALAVQTEKEQKESSEPLTDSKIA